jgi:hypothetical protein
MKGVPNIGEMLMVDRSIRGRNQEYAALPEHSSNFVQISVGVRQVLD